MNNNDFLHLIASDNSFIDVDMAIVLLFMEYKKKCSLHSIYNVSSFLPQNLIKLYYSKGVVHSDFQKIETCFKERYIEHESKMEGVHDLMEINGLGLVYDYIRSDEWVNCSNIYIILLIHLKLFSLTPYPSVGGKFRNSDCYLISSSIDVVPYNCISNSIFSLYQEFDDLLKDGIRLGKDNSFSNAGYLIKYIDNCLRLKAKLIKIHPFYDGNGRTMRALVNLLFKLANLPPIYVKVSEKDTYLDSMNKAIVDNNFEYINSFYYYKICDSIMDLDINDRISNNRRLLCLKKEW